MASVREEGDWRMHLPSREEEDEDEEDEDEEEEDDEERSVHERRVHVYPFLCLYAKLFTLYAKLVTLSQCL